MSRRAARGESTARRCVRVLALPFLGGLLCGAAHGAGEVLPMTAEQQASYGIAVQPVQAGAQVLSGSFPAQVVIPNAQLQVVSAPQAGVIEVMLVAVGDRVRKGQALARVQSPSLLEMERDYLQALTQLGLAADNLERDRKLLADGIIAERRYRETRSRHAEVAASVQQLRQALALVGLTDADLKRLDRERRMTSAIAVASPLDGVVLEQMAVAGQRVEAVSPLYRVGSLAPLWLEIHVPLDRVAGFEIGARVEVAGSGVTGRLLTVGQGVHAVDQGVLVRAEVTEDTGRLRPGQFLQARIASGSAAGGAGSGFRVPRAALARLQDRVQVFVQVPRGFRAQPVEVLGEEGDAAVVSGALANGDKVAVSGTATLKAAWIGMGTGGSE